MDYRLEVRGLIPGRRNIFFSSPQRPDPLWAIQPRIQWIPRALSLGIKRPGREADYSCLRRAEIKTSGAIPRLPHVFMA
jgi:hypothetical protein